METTTELVGNVVRITEIFGNTFLLDKEGVELAISNIKLNRKDYATEEAYRSHLKTYQDALSLFPAEQDPKISYLEISTYSKKEN